MWWREVTPARRRFPLVVFAVLVACPWHWQSWSLVLPLTSRGSLLSQRKSSLFVHYGSQEEDDRDSEKKQTPMASSSDVVRGVDDTSVSAPICRIVTRAGSKLPTKTSVGLVSSIPKNLLSKLDTFYNAEAYKKTQNLSCVDRAAQREQQLRYRETDEEDDPQFFQPAAPTTSSREEGELVSVVRSSLEDAGFELLSRRDLDLCESLNVGYLLRLSIVPDVSQLDPTIAREFYPEFYCINGTVIDKDELLFGGRVLVYWRGYSEEVTKGRLLPPKIDYLQASLVQRSAAWVKRKLDRTETVVVRHIKEQGREIKRQARRAASGVADAVRVKRVAGAIRDLFPLENNTGVVNESSDDAVPLGSFKLGRYGASKIRFVGSPNPTDALDPFTICEVDYNDPEPCPNSHENYMRKLGQRQNNETIAVVEHDMYEGVQNKAYTCAYDEAMYRNNRKQVPARIHLLERVSISNLIDVFTQNGRRNLVKAIVEKSKLVEPTYEEVVVVWRPNVKKKEIIYPPKMVTELADILDIEGFEGPPKEVQDPPRARLEIRNFESVPMSNLPAVLPKTKLIFRPADALLNDMISLVTLLLVASSIRLDSPRLDLIALISFSLWIIRTFFRYSNRLARYDLLVKTFLTSKISHRNSGALKYLASEAGSQRAVRAGLMQSWISRSYSAANAPYLDSSKEKKHDTTRSSLKKRCADEMQKLLKGDHQVQINANRAMDYLEALNLVRFHDDGKLAHVADAEESFECVREAWASIFEDHSGNEVSPDDNGNNETDVGALTPDPKFKSAATSEDSGERQLPQSTSETPRNGIEHLEFHRSNNGTNDTFFRMSTDLPKWNDTIWRF